MYLYILGLPCFSFLPLLLWLLVLDVVIVSYAELLVSRELFYIFVANWDTFNPLHFLAFVEHHQPTGGGSTTS
ncbi:hypothetical protein HYQ46_009213 [Verticillium longisporum]|nr:hypothetical protein HYQ46_009213 [Verticillium longisporum]